MLPDSPLISVIIPVYNRDRYLAEAIESVLNQTYPAIDLIVVDDGSSDRSAEVAQRYPLTYVYQSNQGISAARNAGVALAKGNFIAFLDSDDIWVIDKLSKQMDVFAADSELEAVFGYAQQFYSPDLDESIQRRIKCHSQPIPAYLATAMLIKFEAFLRIGPFDPSLRTSNDINWYILATEKELRYFMLPDVVYYRRLHETNNGLVEHQHRNHFLHLLKAKLDRQRAQQSGKLLDF
uniref:Glycosyl transferase family 2 n=1 Tax=Cyanothece sp. (strain PCC 7425 / ATCC 29141) TaxID=395961 RepID=B8HPX7_CYAP4